jgi:hypothetical protein
MQKETSHDTILNAVWCEPGFLSRLLDSQMDVSLDHSFYQFILAASWLSLTLFLHLACELPFVRISF